MPALQSRQVGRENGTFFSLMNRGGIRKDHALQRTHVESALVVPDSADDPADFFRPQFPAVTQSKAMQLSLLAEQHGPWTTYGLAIVQA
jgi:hypothetical protein